MGMKDQTFGVEVEMNHITRANAAEIAAGYFGTGRFADTAFRNGYSAWSAWDAQGREWKFVSDSSIAGPTSMRCEMVTPILKYEDIENLQGLVRILRHAGAISNPKNGCGIHVHIGAQGHTAKTIRNLVNIMAAHEALLKSALKLDDGRISRFCRMTDPNFLKQLNEQKPDTLTALADVWYVSQNCGFRRSAHYNNSRYHMLNLHATFTKGTIEFRLFQFDNPGTTLKGKHYRGGIHAGQLKSYIQLCMALSQKAKEVRFADPTPQQTNNSKYAMRTWLLRLGFIGDEFKTARDILTRNLRGNAAWRRVA